MARGIAPLLGALVALAAPAPARGQTHDEAAAQALFNEGRAALARRDHRLACSKFEASQKLDPGVGTVLNLAQCKQALGDLAAAWEHLRTAVAELEAKRDHRLDFARKQLADVEWRVPRLTIQRHPATPPGLRVQRDSVDLPGGSLGTPLPVNPGEHVIDVSAPDFAPQRFRVTLVEGEHREIVVAPGAREAAPAAAPDAPDAAGAGSARRTGGWISLGAGAVGLGMGVVSGVVALGARATLEDACGAPVGPNGERRCAPSLESDLDRYRLTRTLSYVGFGVGAVGVGVGIALLLTAPPRGGAPRRGQERKGARLRIEPWISPGLAGVRGVF